MQDRYSTKNCFLLILLVSFGQRIYGLVCPQFLAAVHGTSRYNSYKNVCTSHRSIPEDASEKDTTSDDDALKGILSSDNKDPNLLDAKKNKNPEENIAKKFSLSKNQAISALSQPNPKTRAISELSQSDQSNRKKKTRKKQHGKIKKPETLLPKARMGYKKSKMNDQNSRSRDHKKRRQNSKDEGDSFYSLLPPPMKDQKGGRKNREGDTLSDGLSSWEDFLGGGASQKKPGATSSSPLYRKFQGSREPNSSNNAGPKRAPSRKNIPSFDSTEKLPSIADLFPPDLSAASNRKNSSEEKASSSSVSPPPPALDGVLPVSDLFYRSAQSMNDDEESADDEELPFSAEQSDQLTTDHNKIKIRRNQAKPMASSSSSGKGARRNRTISTPRKMVRRGMEMLVGGVPINADPPQRYVDLKFLHEKSANWNEIISINSRDFGPMLHSSSVNAMSEVEKGLYCEHFVHSAIKWDVCPKDLKTVVKSYTAEGFDSATTNSKDPLPSDNVEKVAMDEEKDNDAASVISSLGASEQPGVKDQGVGAPDESEVPSLGFGKLKSFNKKSNSADGEEDSALQSHLGGELVFSIGVSREELESADTPTETPVLERVLARGIIGCIDTTGFDVYFTKLLLTDMNDGTTKISGQFTLTLKKNESMSFGEMEKKAQRMNSSLAQAMDDGDMQLALAAAAREETGWPQAVRDRVVEEFLFEDDDGDGPLYEGENEVGEPSLVDTIDTSAKSKLLQSHDEEATVDSLNEIKNDADDHDDYDGPFGMPGSVVYHKDDIFLGGGNDGVFWNYAEENASNAPYRGGLGLRLVDAAVERMKERHPRVIAIGDVHGCIDELQDLLRQCDYRPGDIVVFLGDLVSKGPDSISVVQMAREIGAIGVRGNHDFEVIRWHQAIKSGVDPPVVGSEHFHIASCLSKGDMKWMYSLPWYISSKELGALFVHAGFVSGIRLAKQNPRLMMNMRSILPDGTVTSKFFNNWPWARLWDGPQTVLFGHDADRGLQQYEHAIGLDTGCVYGGRLTACILPEKRLVSVSARREYFKYRRKHYD